MIERLRQHPGCFRFIQAVRLLERRAANGVKPGRGSTGPGEGGATFIGGPHPLAEEPVRFRTPASLRFPTAEVLAVEAPRRRDADGDHDAEPGAASADVHPALEMTVGFIGLTGPAGVLPQHYTTTLIQQTRAKRPPNFALHDFFDLFNHRLISLFYRAAGKYRLPLAWERSALGGKRGDDGFTAALYALAGLGTSGLRRRLALGDESVLYFSGHFAHRPRCAISLERIIAERFGVPAHIDQFRGCWLALSPADRTTMPSAVHPNGANSALGVNAIAGEKVWDVQSRFCVRLGPLTFDRYCRFTPAGSDFHPLGDLVRLYAGAEFDFDIQPVLRADEVPPTKLGGDAPERGGRLGWTTWAQCGADGSRGDFDEATFEFDDLATASR